MEFSFTKRPLKRTYTEDIEVYRPIKRVHIDKEPLTLPLPKTTDTTEDVIMSDVSSTDEDEPLDDSLFTDYSDEDMEYSDALERGWSGLYNDDNCWTDNTN
ncbi:hypothetical protein G6F56_011522 [Rhizopus delemar]|nr:hypothetical protein G6F56_011522 [Rhizopus delemar]